MLAACGLPAAACAASRSRAEEPARAAERLRVVTWNIRHGAGGDGRVDLARTAAALARLAPDVALLQEVDRGCRRSGGVDQAEFLGRELGLASAFAAHRPFDGGEYGLAILARRAILATRAIALVDAPRPLVALEARLARAGGGELTIVCVHLVDTPEERAAEARALARELASSASPVLVGGDFNGPRESEPLAAFAGYEVALPAEPRATYPAGAPVKEIDFLLTRAGAGASFAAAKVAPEGVASDHRPVVADWVLAATPAARG